ncbi:hypothetical protein J6590_000424 [Homalodisca vitripennis]|nr:hypothetical protein J6590_000424 [Homalodisca vitripennis]
MGHSESSPLVPTKSGRSERSSMERKPRHVVTRSRTCLTLREENFLSSSWLIKLSFWSVPIVWASTFILTWRRGYRDHEGGSPRMRPFHCTTVGLTPANAPNVGISGA